MNKLKIVVFLLACLSLTIYACKKETLSDQQFVQDHFVGRWPLKSRILLTIKNKDTIKPTSADTIRFSPIDTLIFTADGKYTKGLTTGTYKIDDKGENLTITLSTSPPATPVPPVTWHIEYLRKTSIVLVQRRTETIGTDVFTYHTEENLIK